MLLSEKITLYIHGKTIEKLTKFDKETLKKRRTITGLEQLAQFEAQRNEQRFKLEESLQPTNWITDAAKRAKQISLVTHALKFTHSDAKGSSIFDSNIQIEENSPGYLTSASLSNRRPDIVGNAAVLDVAKFLFLEDEGKTLISYLQQGDASPLQYFVQSTSQLSEWTNAFLQVLSPKELSSHSLAKQVYFKINEKNEYHLLSPLFPSSLMQEVYERIYESRYSESAKEARKARRDKKYSDKMVIFYPNIMVHTFGGTKPQNISQLNSGRHGRAYLFCSAPPTWKAEVKPPSKNFIFNVYGPQVKEQINDLKKFLLSIRGQSKNMSLRDLRGAKVDELMDSLLNYAAQIQRLPAGWSKTSSLPKYQQLWLDPKRAGQDEEFKMNREKKLWLKQTSSQFARWLNNKLKHKHLNLGDPEFQHWRDLLSKKLKEMEELLEI